MAKVLSVYNRLQAGDYENGNGGKRRVSTKSTYSVYPRNASVVSSFVDMTSNTTRHVFKTAPDIVLGHGGSSNL